MRMEIQPKRCMKAHNRNALSFPFMNTHTIHCKWRTIEILSAMIILQWQYFHCEELTGFCRVHQFSMRALLLIPLDDAQKWSTVVTHI